MIGNDTEFARWLGVNKSSVSRARKAGRLVLAPNGKVDFEPSRTRWIETQAGRTDVTARHAEKRGSSIAEPTEGRKNATRAHSASRSTPAEQNEPAEPTESADTRLKAKALLIHYENSQIKLEMALRRGLRIERAAIRREAHGIGATLRAGIERVIDQTAPRLAAASTEDQRRQILQTEISRLRWIIKRELPRAMRRMKTANEKNPAGRNE